ncbi:hypothetical protein EDEG_02408 [Edhazardia aedis USNM 41457]|uniref:Uncharacterized protein n=1 Tax=Edhazardia aedis (strain USNM 41457) TaxID=1003232 RepID=J9DKX2_EDHAE|nr:hypothetical protein EDEG_02408 [Edhazardia aedis USNM 41457]|eukprot:EJW03240.1 hypothetical protein EDEG_02408 [Edhazardia aedis USNM 41457]
MINLTSLNIEGLSTISKISNTNIEILNVASCYHFDITTLDKNKITHLNLSKVNLTTNQIKYLREFHNLIDLNLSWNSNLTDELFIDLLESLSNIKTVTVFGDFALTKKTAQFAYENRNRLRIIGNPSETGFLLDNI